MGKIFTKLKDIIVKIALAVSRLVTCSSTCVNNKSSCCSTTIYNNDRAEGEVEKNVE